MGLSINSAIPISSIFSVSPSLSGFTNTKAEPGFEAQGDVRHGTMNQLCLPKARRGRSWRATRITASSAFSERPLWAFGAAGPRRLTVQIARLTGLRTHVKIQEVGTNKLCDVPLALVEFANPRVLRVARQMAAYNDFRGLL